MKNTGIEILGASITNDHSASIIVVGLGRGGTSAIAASLNALGINMGENFHTPIYEDLDLAKALRLKDWRQLKNLIKNYESTHAIFGWKLPDSHEHLERIYKYFSNPYFIFVYKDIFAISLRRNMVHGKDIFKNMSDSLQGYQKILSFIQKRNPNALHVSYEKMIANKEEYAESLARFCGVTINHEVKSKVIQSIGDGRHHYDVWAGANRQRTLLKTHGYDGCVDETTSTHIRGWLVNLQSEAPVTLELLVNNATIKQTLCNSPRDDLIRALVSSTGKAGFKIDISELTIASSDTISLRVKGTQCVIPIKAQ